MSTCVEDGPTAAEGHIHVRHRRAETHPFTADTAPKKVQPQSLGIVRSSHSDAATRGRVQVLPAYWDHSSTTPGRPSSWRL